MTVTAPTSLAAHKLNAEALEMQGKWGPAELEYEGMIKSDPNARGIHFLLGRLLLSRPDAGPDAPERAKQEFLKELQLDPSNAGAEYILGEETGALGSAFSLLAMVFMLLSAVFIYWIIDRLIPGKSHG